MSPCSSIVCSLRWGLAADANDDDQCRLTDAELSNKLLMLMMPADADNVDRYWWWKELNEADKKSLNLVHWCFDDKEMSIPMSIILLILLILNISWYLHQIKFFLLLLSRCPWRISVVWRIRCHLTNRCHLTTMYHLTNRCRQPWETLEKTQTKKNGEEVT